MRLFLSATTLHSPSSSLDMRELSNPSVGPRILGLSNTSFADCVKHDPEVSEDTEKNFAELLTEELKLQEAEALENQQRADMALLEAKKITSQYQKEADKCSSGMETCEEAREKSELTLVAQKKLTAMWELRARQRGWKEDIANSRTQNQRNVQTV
ncbi:uncharacterized protein LOC121248633 isoform X2 [Juglans microcarpa x Juglans regia]|uniref:uncharacterized protein LOC121248633 isoform X2 n=1 Tax=Juglans microcarpa x Juglans regia TaxID=2249226 RepID=UPI001B7E5A95|nr:uncharacterized protein LOC121248633 isoform X2 [Juglans microcarpa x Juglans regia]